MNTNNIKSIKKSIAIFSVIFTVALTSICFGCASTEEIPEDLTANQIMQKGHEAFGNGNYKNAERYFSTTVQRYGTNTETYIEARYELAHLYVRTKEYDKATEIFNELLEIYDYDTTGSLPTAYKKLCQMGLEQIENK